MYTVSRRVLLRDERWKVYALYGENPKHAAQARNSEALQELEGNRWQSHSWAAAGPREGGQGEEDEPWGADESAVGGTREKKER